MSVLTFESLLVGMDERKRGRTTKKMGGGGEDPRGEVAARQWGEQGEVLASNGGTRTTEPPERGKVGSSAHIIATLTRKPAHVKF